MPEPEGTPQGEPQEPKPTDQSKDDALDLGQFKNPKDLLKSYKEVQGAFTRTTQENKTLKEELEKFKEQVELSKYKPQGQYQQPPMDARDFDEMLAQDPKKAIESVNANTYKQMRIAEVLEEIQFEDPDNFSNRYSYAQTLSQNPQYAHLANSAVGVRRLFKLGDELRDKEVRRNASKQLEAILGGPVDDQKIAKLRDLLGTGQNAQQTKQTQTQLGNVYMPDTSDTYRPGVDAQVDKRKEFDEAERKAAQEGDLEGVLRAAFGKALAE